jgi:hypothetical protein
MAMSAFRVIFWAHISPIRDLQLSPSLNVGYARSV